LPTHLPFPPPPLLRFPLFYLPAPHLPYCLCQTRCDPPWLSRETLVMAEVSLAFPLSPLPQVPPIVLTTVKEVFFRSPFSIPRRYPHACPVCGLHPSSFFFDGFVTGMPHGSTTLSHFLSDFLHENRVPPRMSPFPRAHFLTSGRRHLFFVTLFFSSPDRSESPLFSPFLSVFLTVRVVANLMSSWRFPTYPRYLPNRRGNPFPPLSPIFCPFSANFCFPRSVSKPLWDSVSSLPRCHRFGSFPPYVVFSPTQVDAGEIGCLRPVSALPTSHDFENH